MNNKEITSKNKYTLAFGLGLAFFVTVLIGLISVAWWIGQILVDQKNSPVSLIVISGEMPYTQRDDVLNAINKVDLDNFFKVNVNDIQKYVSALPWVYSVAVRKQWPNEVKIYIVDQTPVASWNGDFLLNQFGKAFQADTTKLNLSLPQFFGPEGSELLALENFISLNGLLEYRDLTIDELVLSERFSWQLTLSDGVLLNLGREERVKRIQRFMDVYPLIKRQLAEKNNVKTKIKAKANIKNRGKQEKQTVDYIDLRYDTGLAVGYKSLAYLAPSIKKINRTFISTENKQKDYLFSENISFKTNIPQTEELTLNV